MLPHSFLSPAPPLSGTALPFPVYNATVGMVNRLGGAPNCTEVVQPCLAFFHTPENDRNAFRPLGRYKKHFPGIRGHGEQRLAVDSPPHLGNGDTLGLERFSLELITNG